MKSQKILCFCALTLFFFASCKKDISTSLRTFDGSVIESAPANHFSLSVNVNANCGGYYVAIPKRYDSTNISYPLILFIHGIGELGNGTTDLPNMVRAGLPRLINKNQFPPSFQSGGQQYSFIVVAPQFKEWPTNQDVNSVLQYAMKKYRVDATRIYVTGLSMGGGVTWDFSAEFGASIAAIAPVCGGSYPDDTRASNIASFGLPVWAFHNNDDPTVPVSYSVGYVTKINSHHPEVAAKVTTWTTGGHDAWTKAYNPSYKENNMNMYEWMLQYTRSAGLKN